MTQTQRLSGENLFFVELLTFHRCIQPVTRISTNYFKMHLVICSKIMILSTSNSVLVASLLSADLINMSLFMPGLPERRQCRAIRHQWWWLLLAEGDIVLRHWHAGLDDHIERWPAQLYRRLGHWCLLHRLRFPGHQHLCGHPV